MVDTVGVISGLISFDPKVLEQLGCCSSIVSDEDEFDVKIEMSYKLTLEGIFIFVRMHFRDVLIYAVNSNVADFTEHRSM